MYHKVEIGNKNFLSFFDVLQKHEKNYCCEGYWSLVLEKICASYDVYEASFFVAANDFTENH